MGKELKYLNRRELIEIIYQLKKSEQDLQAENERLKKELEEKRITLSKAGSVADAAFALSDIFFTAQSTADAYLAEIEQRRSEAEKTCSRILDDAYRKSEDMIRKAAEQRDAMVAETKQAYSLLKKYDAAIEEKRMEYAMYDNWSNQ